MKVQTHRALVLGASSGIGAACAEKLAKEGYQVGLLARRETELTKICEKINSQKGSLKPLKYVFDIKNFKDCPQMFDKIVTELGGLDLIIYAAGVMPIVSEGEYSFEKDQQMIEVNLLGAIAWLNEAALYFSRIKNGLIVGISSVAGERGRKGNPVYGTSKAGLNAYLESLRNRLDSSSVHILTVKPGFIDTPMTKGREGLFWLISADEAARQIFDGIRGRKNTIYVPKRWQLVGIILKCIPSFLFRKLDI